MKTIINETINLMQRMKLFEGNGNPRIQVTRNEIIDIMNEQDENGAGRWVSLIYVTVKPIYNTKKNWRKDDVDNVISKYSREGNESWFDAVSNFNNDSEGKIKKLGMNKSIVVVTKYLLNWTSDNSYAKAYSDYDDKLTTLRMRQGVAIQSAGKLGDNKNQRQDLGNQVQMNQTGNLSKDFNFANVKSSKTTCYVIDEGGHIIGELPEEMFKAMTKNTAPNLVEKDVQEALAGNEEALNAYIEAKKEIMKAFKGRNLLFDRILAIVGSVNGTDYYYINDAVKHEISKDSGVFVSPQDLTDIAKEQLSTSITDVKNYQSQI